MESHVIHQSALRIYPLVNLWGLTKFMSRPSAICLQGLDSSRTPRYSRSLCNLAYVYVE